ncbi:S8 family serine peptidase [Kitasatospora cinereorecta]|uniref:S8 family serine peptidase n=1 Tax=Kitasatospora cinereorecta TaxID=285560 RepID=A0ABW0VF03_9ACTN
MTLTKATRVLGATTLAGAMLFTAAPASSADQVRDGQWVNSYFDLTKVWSVSKGDGVIVAVIDEGVDASHPDLSGSVLPGIDATGKGLDQHPTENHGTKMAGIIAAHGHGSGNAEGAVGLAPGAKILPVYKLAADGSDGIPQGIRWSVDHGAKVINISQGSSDAPKSIPQMNDAVAYAAQHDVLIVAAAGNSGLGKVENPANEPGVLAVSATDKTDAMWSQSNYGAEVLLAAPGVRIVSTGACSGGQYCIGDGTSDSVAYVSAAAALVRAKFPKLTAGQVVNRLTKSAFLPAAVSGAKLPDAHYGYGIIRPYDALTKDIPAGPAQGPLAKPASAPSGASSPSGQATSGGSDQASGLPSLPGVPKGNGSDTTLSFGGLFAAIGAVVAIVIIAIIVLAIKGRRRRPAGPVPPQGQPPYGAAPNWPPAQQPYGNQAPPPGYPQQNPYQSNNPYNPGGNQSQR